MRRVNAGILLIGLYVIASVCVFIMRKIQPDNKRYPVRTVFVCIAITIFLIVYGWMVPDHLI